MKKNALSFLSVLLSYVSLAQNYQPGEVYYGLDSFTEYRVGNLPIILSAPHGGYLTPTHLPDRDCVGCVTQRDSYTQELTRQIEASIIFKTGCSPHVVINKLHRMKLDANREIIEATDSNSVTEPFWHDYMNFADSARNIVLRDYQKGVFFDIHGHGHTIQRLEIGFLLSSNDLRLTDSALNSSPYNTKTSLLNSIGSNLNGYSHAHLIRGENSFGSMIQRKGFPAIPSDSIPFPLIGEPYFNGGYNTARFGSRNGGAVDAIQIESHQGVRFNSTERIRYADSLAEVILDYLEKHYFTNFSNGYCNYLSSLSEINTATMSVFPNPTSEFISVKNQFQTIEYSVINLQGKIVKEGSLQPNTRIDVRQLQNGMYLVYFKNKQGISYSKFIKQ